MALVNKAGFTLIEVIIAITISSMMAVSVFMIFRQMQDSSRRINSIIDLDVEDSVISNQLERDVNGIFVPWMVEDDKKVDSDGDGQKEQAQQADKQKSEQEEKETKEKEAAPKDGVSQKEKKSQKKLIPIKNPLVLVQGGDRLEKLSFITNNPLPVYGMSSDGSTTRAKQCVARVEYTVESSPESPLVYRLYRQESDGLGSNEQKQPMKYLLSDRIKTISVKLYAAKKKEQKKPTATQPAGPNAKVAPGAEEQDASVEDDKLIELTAWDDDVVKSNNELQPNFLPLIVKVSLEVWESRNPSPDDQTRPYDFYYTVYAYASGAIKPTAFEASQQRAAPASQQAEGDRGQLAPNWASRQPGAQQTSESAQQAEGNA
jgi:prepilin-type N-terminal cleavage/methylation domain-containing protein